MTRGARVTVTPLVVIEDSSAGLTGEASAVGVPEMVDPHFRAGEGHLADDTGKGFRTGSLPRGLQKSCRH